MTHRLITITVEGVAKLLALALEAIKLVISIKERKNDDGNNIRSEEPQPTQHP